MKKESEIFKTVLDNWDEDESPLKDSLQIKVKDIEKISNTAERIRKIDNISVVR